MLHIKRNPMRNLSTWLAPNTWHRPGGLGIKYAITTEPIPSLQYWIFISIYIVQHYMIYNEYIIQLWVSPVEQNGVSVNKFPCSLAMTQSVTW